MRSTDETLLHPTLALLRKLMAGRGPERLERVVVRPGWTAVLGTGGACGAAMNFIGSPEAFGAPALDEAKVLGWAGRSLFEVAEAGLAATSWQERAIGVASLSALSQPFLEPSALARRGLEAWDGDFGDLVRPEDRVLLVGFGGMVNRLRGRCRELHVTDLRPQEAFLARVLGTGASYSPADVLVHGPEANETLLREVDAVAITGSALVNGTLAGLLAAVGRARLVAVYGASAGFIPDVLLEHGVHLVQSHRITDPAAFERGALLELGLEPVIKRSQAFQCVRRRQG
jgi:uncharacterized protein (DUF4213/DUF364 family)